VRFLLGHPVLWVVFYNYYCCYVTTTTTVTTFDFCVIGYSFWVAPFYTVSPKSDFMAIVEVRFKARCSFCRHTIQVMHDRLQVSAWNGTDVSVGDVIADLVGGWLSSVTFSWPWSTYSSLQTNDCWQKNIVLCWSIAWNSLPAYLKDETLSLDSFRSSLKTFLLATYWQRMEHALETFWW